MTNSNKKIDFVIIWVDGNDPKWIEEYNKYVSKDKTIDIRNFRFRDWDNLQYWFRSVEKFTPWVNKIHFVTWGHIPKWLNTNHPKLNIVNHKDYIPKEFLPTFSSHPIEINLHRIKGLSEKFVYFNDDMFIIKPTNKDRFFKNELPCDIAAETILSPNGISHIKLNTISLINNNFSKKKQFKKNITKWINFKYNFKSLVRTILLLPFENYADFYDHHTPNPFLKNTLQNVWEKNEKILHQTSSSKFRSLSDINQYIFRYWQLVSGNFTPYYSNDTKSLSIFNNDKNLQNKELSKKNKEEISLINKEKIEEIKDIIKNQKYRMICLNDGYSSEEEYIIAKNKIIDAFNSILPDKSNFEL